MQVVVVVVVFVAICLSCWRVNARKHCNGEAINDGDYPSLDVVYTYVNGNDEQFLKEKASHEAGENNAADQKNKATRTSDAANARRFVDHDELRMSIRSVLKNMSTFHDGCQRHMRLRCFPTKIELHIHVYSGICSCMGKDG